MNKISDNRTSHSQNTSVSLGDMLKDWAVTKATQSPGESLSRHF